MSQPQIQVQPSYHRTRQPKYKSRPLTPEPRLIHPSTKIHTVDEWLEQSITVHSTYKCKKCVLDRLQAYTNQPPQQLIDTIRTHRNLSLAYDTADLTVKAMIVDGYAQRSVSEQRAWMKNLFEYCKIPVKKEDWKKYVQPVKAKTTTLHKTPDDKLVKACLTHAPPLIKAAISVQVSTYCRIGELVQLRIANIDFTRDPVTVHFPAMITKTQNQRFAFLSTEATEIVKQYLATRPNQSSQWLFPGKDKEFGKAPTGSQDVHITTQAIMIGLRKLFKSLGREEIDSRTNVRAYTSHGFRRAGLNIAKRLKYPTDWAEFIAGHETGTREHYLPDELGPDWKTIVEPHMNFLTPPEKIREIVQTDPELMKQLLNSQQMFQQAMMKINDLTDRLSAVESENKRLKQLPSDTSNQIPQ